MRYDNLPACCHDCNNLDAECCEHSDKPFWYCEINVLWPVKRKTCKKQLPYKDRMIANSIAADCEGEG